MIAPRFVALHEEMGYSASMGGMTESGARLPHEIASTGDRRGRSRSARDRRRAAEDALLDALLLPHDHRTEGVGSEGQALLVKALARIARQDGVEAAVAWSVDSEGEPRVLAAQPADSASRIQPNREFYGAVAALGEPTRLTDGDLTPPLSALAARGVSAIAPVAGLGSKPSALILVFPRVHGRPLRPRTIAVLTEVSHKLGQTMSTNLALDRLGPARYGGPTARPARGARRARCGDRP